jgi:hypothetical protein
MSLYDLLEHLFIFSDFVATSKPTYWIEARFADVAQLICYARFHA